MANQKSETTDQRSEIHAYPSDVTFHDLMARNRRNSIFLLIGMGLLVVLLAEAIMLGLFMYGGKPPHIGAVIGIAVGAMVLTTLAGSWSYFSGAQTLLSISGAKPIEKQHDPQLFNVVEELSIAAGLPMPKVYMIQSDALNAFATGRDPTHAAVAITRGLRQQLTRDELAGVMAHEMAHVRHLDIRLTMLVATMVGMIVLACDLFLRMSIYAPRGGSRRSGKGGGGAAILLILALVLAIVAPLLAKLIQLAVSRQREYLADAGAVELTRYPKGLADALAKLAADTKPLETANRATAHMYIVNPILNAKGRENLNSMFSTHPPMRERIARLHALMR